MVSREEVCEGADEEAGGLLLWREAEEVGVKEDYVVFADEGQLSFTTEEREGALLVQLIAYFFCFEAELP